MRCPKCTSLVLMPPAVAGDAGSLTRCPRCAAVWVTRPGDDPVAGAQRPPLVRSAPRIIENDAPPAGGGRRWWAFGRAGTAATCAVLALGLVAALGSSADAPARPEAGHDEVSR